MRRTRTREKHDQRQMICSSSSKSFSFASLCPRLRERAVIESSMSLCIHRQSNSAPLPIADDYCRERLVFDPNRNSAPKGVSPPSLFEMDLRHPFPFETDSASFDTSFFLRESILIERNNLSSMQSTDSCSSSRWRRVNVHSPRHSAVAAIA